MIEYCVQLINFMTGQCSDDFNISCYLSLWLCSVSGVIAIELVISSYFSSNYSRIQILFKSLISITGKCQGKKDFGCYKTITLCCVYRMLYNNNILNEIRKL